MKDYSLGYDEEFIQSYDVKDNIMTINLAGGKKRILPYDRNVEIVVLKIMRNQVINMGYEEEIRECLKYSKINLVLSGLISSVVSFLLLSNHILISGALIPYIFATLNFYIALCQVWNVIEQTILLNDIKKNKVFIKNEMNLGKKFRIGKERRIININDIQKIPYKKLNSMIKKTNKVKKRILKK